MVQSFESCFVQPQKTRENAMNVLNAERKTLGAKAMHNGSVDPVIQDLQEEHTPSKQKLVALHFVCFVNMQSDKYGRKRNRKNFSEIAGKRQDYKKGPASDCQRI